MPTIKFVKEKKSIDVAPGSNLRKEALKSGVQLYPGIHSTLHCPGLGLCGTCRVHIKKGCENVSRQGLFERIRMLGPLLFFARLGHEEELRLACQMKVNGDVEIETQPPLNLHGDKFWG